jgi:hypothetical protein
MQWLGHVICRDSFGWAELNADVIFFFLISDEVFVIRSRVLCRQASGRSFAKRLYAHPKHK